jgi:hypothetical protein
MQAAVDVQVADDWSIGVWASLTASRWRKADEVDIYAARTGTLGKVDYEVIASAYVAPGLMGGTYVELQGLLRRPVGSTEVEFQLAIVPHQSRAVPDNVYAAINATMPLIPGVLDILVHGGFEQGMADGKVDLEAALLGQTGRLRYRLSAIGSTKQYGPGRGTAGVVFALSRDF